MLLSVLATIPEKHVKGWRRECLLCFASHGVPLLCHANSSLESLLVRIGPASCLPIAIGVVEEMVGGPSWAPAREFELAGIRL